MIMSLFFTAVLLFSTAASAILGRGSALSGAILTGAQSGVTLALSMAGAICLWSGISRLMEHLGVTALLARLLKPLLRRIFPGTREDPVLAGHISANICANFLGLGNAATPLGIRAVQRMALSSTAGVASDEMCRLIVLNTASIQLIPTTVAAVRGSLGCAAPFDLLPAVWVSSLLSAGAGVLAAWLLGKVWRHD